MRKNISIKNKSTINKTPNLYDVLKSGYDYGNGKKKKSKSLESQGYILDPTLSNKNHQTYFNKDTNKLLFNVNGTNRASDWITNLKLATGIGYKESDRYKSSHKALRDAKQKYKVNNATVSGHSQGGLTANYISSKGDNVVTLDKATTIGGKSKSNARNYRTENDLISFLNHGRTNNINIKNESPQTGITAYDLYKAHDLEHIKNKNIFI